MLIPPRQNGRYFADDIFKYIFVNEKVCIFIKISLNFVPKGPIDNNTALVQIMPWRRIGDRPLSEPMLTIYVAQGGDELILSDTVGLVISYYLFRYQYS